MAEAKGIKLFGTTISPKNQNQKSETIANQDAARSYPDSESLEKRLDDLVPCPRCKSMDTKFCYYNNYNVNQPRHFCRGCQRYWTAGGALRHVVIGAGTRKTKLPYRRSEGFPESCLFEDSSQVFPSKRQRSISNGQSY